MTCDFYCIALKHLHAGKLLYGRQAYNFEAGVLAFVAPQQLIAVEAASGGLVHSGRLLLVHPDFLWNTPLAGILAAYDFFGYQLNEALHLSDEEESQLLDILEAIDREYRSSADQFSRAVVIAHLSLLLTYSDRFYQRQFITRAKSGHRLFQRFEHLLNDHFGDGVAPLESLPTVSSLADRLHVSPNYLSRLLRTTTGKSTQSHIHNKIIAVAKQKLSTTELTVNEIAYALGFEHPQSFGKLFKQKTNKTPLQFRRLHNEAATP